MYDATGNFNPYSKAPNTAHIAWVKPTLSAAKSADQFPLTKKANSHQARF
jgi:hypothetical protein